MPMDITSGPTYSTSTICILLQWAKNSSCGADREHGIVWSQPAHSLFNAFSHSVYTAGLALFLVATFYGYGGYMASFLRLEIFRYISKLTYGIYLLNPIVIGLYELTRTHFPHYSYSEFAYLCTANIAFTIAFSFIIHLTVEKPFMNLERLLFENKNNNNNKTTESEKQRSSEQQQQQTLEQQKIETNV
ncbi:hypothetical protein PPL_12242 [Heterostelium album PN500]|uniref:Uncharacterized protein n=1 Tax=Heterostelium pallidum (strain ATCC 26659 / Pp 5 / PN500) TaxID=670386 RepID=D3BM34_HETP5|nr:hypothetical protein PPL_12242 [Heterostelium album PN500]EFA77635.1 hypothetical protein PPL_12242 [Heterostelium album PN500]|eukprot:XP_020429763.1 hypothetical protein PPL_12242 [Heterostelium album PN500]